MDTIANLLTTIRNAEMAGLKTASMPTSKMKKAVVTILKENGYIASFTEEGKVLSVSLTKIKHSYKRVSKPGRRLYVGVDEIPLVLGGKGMVIVSTSQGVLSGREARKRKLGGELVCEVY